MRDDGAGRTAPATANPGPLDEPAFVELTRRHHRELQVHCYRMVGSVTQAEDLVQETFLRAWRARAGFQGRASLRTWLYRIATNVCLDALAHSARRSVPSGLFGDPLAESTELQPYPDRLLPAPVGDPGAPEPGTLQRETIELAFIAGLLHLPPRQRAAFVLGDVLGRTPPEVAADLGLTVAATNSLLQRARATLRSVLPADREGWRRPTVTDDERAVLQRYIDAHDRGDPDAILAMLRADTTVTMPPEPPSLGGVASAELYRTVLDPERTGRWRLVATAANGQPAVAAYLRRPGEDRFAALSIDVLRVADGQLVAVNCFFDTALFERFGLPEVLDP